MVVDFHRSVLMGTAKISLRNFLFPFHITNQKITIARYTSLFFQHAFPNVMYFCKKMFYLNLFCSLTQFVQIPVWIIDLYFCFVYISQSMHKYFYLQQSFLLVLFLKCSYDFLQSHVSKYILWQIVFRDGCKRSFCDHLQYDFATLPLKSQVYLTSFLIQNGVLNCFA